MKKHRKAILALAIVTAFVTAGLFLPVLIGAANFNPDSLPGSIMDMLEEIYDKVANIGSAPVEKTGQIESYATGDDGYWKKGVAWPFPRFTDNEDGTVTDNLTKLVWLQDASCFGKKIWAGALIDCNGLADGECGLSDGSVAGDWRLPNVKELLSLIDYGEYNKALPSEHPFTDVKSNVYWSSTTYAREANFAWSVDMGTGYASYGVAKAGVSYFVWPVRGGN
jgi:hypothetical protein